MMSGLGQAGFNVGLDGVVGSFVVNGWLFCCWMSAGLVTRTTTRAFIAVRRRVESHIMFVGSVPVRGPAASGGNPPFLHHMMTQ